MAFISPPPLGLYIHIPWCLRKCPYCDFNSHETEGCPDAMGYVRALLADLQLELPLAKRREISTIFIGGGTPSLFPPEAIRTLLLGVRSRMAVVADAEITMEASPGTYESGRFEGYLEAGVNRLSLGVQSFDDRALGMLGRIHDASQARAAVTEAMAAGFDSINLDLMFGLPGQVLAGSEADVAEAIAFKPQHISFYQLSLEPNTLFYARPPKLPDEDHIIAFQEAGQSLLASAGYHQYEVSAYAQPGMKCRHNLNYWRFGDYIGIGAGAHGKLARVESGQVQRRWRQKHPVTYMDAAGAERAVSSRELIAEDLSAEFMLNALRLRDGFEPELFEARTGLLLGQVEPGLLKAREMGLLEPGSERIVATDQGWRFLNDLVALFC
ncbi:radical SAM family heme chaperone HemW [Solemya velesiana gill symbiont]|uniref:Heme chaperone HemW n=1 Tax=Solemya velesiana gill symbiont TaxID=1918948 RepID=A0A1T2KYB1_9GAMM|nr:radical SAM family heme chaperone HemW [Solemya velesiana gill symbiont]OOZ37835.1 YggW family oxidoreductase [Solemya velesiana gill symbiont]